MIDINNIISEEIQSLVERQEGVYTIPELAQLLNVYGLGNDEQKIIQNILLAAYKEGGDEKVEQVYNDITNIDIEHITKGRYVFQRLVNPDKVKQAVQNARYTLSDATAALHSKKTVRE